MQALIQTILHQGLPLQGTRLDRGSACQAQLGLGSYQQYKLTWQKCPVNMALLFLIPKLTCLAPSPLPVTATDLRHRLQVLAYISFTSHTKTSPYQVIHQNYSTATSLWEGLGSLQVVISLPPASPCPQHLKLMGVQLETGCGPALFPELQQERQWRCWQLGVPWCLRFNSTAERVLH